MSAWISNAETTLIYGGWLLVSAGLLAHGIQGTWRPENKWWPGALALGIIGTFTWWVTMTTARAADLAVPAPAKPPERCLITGENPDPGQTLHVDKRCKSGMRWVYER